MDRKYKSTSIYQLEEIAKTQDANVLKEIKNELSNRSTVRSRALRCEIEKRLNNTSSSFVRPNQATQTTHYESTRQIVTMAKLATTKSICGCCKKEFEIEDMIKDVDLFLCKQCNTDRLNAIEHAKFCIKLNTDAYMYKVINGNPERQAERPYRYYSIEELDCIIDEYFEIESFLDVIKELSFRDDEYAIELFDVARNFLNRFGLNNNKINECIGFVVCGRVAVFVCDMCKKDFDIRTIKKHLGFSYCASCMADIYKTQKQNDEQAELEEVNGACSWSRHHKPHAGKCYCYECISTRRLVIDVKNLRKRCKELEDRKLELDKKLKGLEDKNGQA